MAQYRLIDLFRSYCDIPNIQDREIGSNKKAKLSSETQSRIIWSAIKPLVKKYEIKRTHEESFNDNHRKLIASFLQLKLEPSPDKEFLILEKQSDGSFWAMITTEKDTHSLGLTPWREMFNRYLSPEMLSQYSKEEIMTHFLLECTYYGYDEATVDKKIEKQVNRPVAPFNIDTFVPYNRENFMQRVEESRRRICAEMGMTEEEYEEHLEEQERINETDWDSETD